MKNGAHPIFRLTLLTLILCLLLTGIAVSVSAQGEQIVASDDHAISVHLPAGWVFRTMGKNTVYASSLVVAEDSTVLDGAINYFLLGNGAVPGDFAIIAVVDPAFWGVFSPYPEQAALGVLNALLNDPSAPWTINDQFQYSIGNRYTAVVSDVTSAVRNLRGYVGGFVAGNDVVVFALNVSPLRDFDNERALLESIGDTIQVPAEANALTAINILETPTEALIANLPTRVPPTAAPPTAAAPADDEIITIPADEDRLSLSIPAEWFVIDHAAELGVYTYGDTEDAVRSRFGSVRPDLVENPVPLSGNGGAIVLYKMADYGVNPNAVDLQPLMSQLVQNLTGSGYEVLEPVTPLDGDASHGIYVVVRGAEHGFIALVPFGDEIAYISATSASDSFDANRDLLMSVLRSVRVPAGQADTPTPEIATTTTTGLGGLGGVQQTPTSEPTLGGMSGILGNKAPTATPTP